MGSLIAVVLLVAAGLPGAWALTRNVFVTLVLAPLVTALEVALAVMAMLVVGGPFALWSAVAVLAGAGGAVLAARRWPVAPLPFGGGVDAAVLALPLAVPMLAVLQPPVGWDAHSIWWFHASWFGAGGGAAREAMASAVIGSFAHPDYPPLAPATVAAAWGASGGTSFRLAQIVTGVLTWSALVLLAFAVRSLARRAPAMVGRLCGLGVALGAWFVAPTSLAAGYVDHLWAAALIGAAVLLLVADVDAPRLRLAAVLLAVAALTKNEGTVAAVVVAALFTLRTRHQLRRALWVAGPVALAAVWVVLARAVGATSDLAGSERVTALKRGDLAALERLGPAFTALRQELGVLVLVAAAVAVLGGAFLWRARRRLRLGNDLWIWSLVALYGASVLATYVISPYDLGWHLATSLDRVSVAIVLAVLASVASWVVVATSRLGPDRRPGAVGAVGADAEVSGSSSGARRTTGRATRSST